MNNIEKRILNLEKNIPIVKDQLIEQSFYIKKGQGLTKEQKSKLYLFKKIHFDFADFYWRNEINWDDLVLYWGKKERLKQQLNTK